MLCVCVCCVLCRYDINLEGHWCSWVCSLWTSTAGEKLYHMVETQLEEFFLEHVIILYLPSLCPFLSIEGELPSCHQVVFWAAGRHQAVYVVFMFELKRTYGCIFVFFMIFCMRAAVRPYTAETYVDETMTVYQVPLFGESIDSLCIFRRILVFLYFL